MFLFLTFTIAVLSIYFIEIDEIDAEPVSYTHLTLPTIYSV